MKRCFAKNSFNVFAITDPKKNQIIDCQISKDCAVLHLADEKFYSLTVESELPQNQCNHYKLVFVIKAFKKITTSMLNITYKDRRTNIWVRERTKVIDIISNVRKKEISQAVERQPGQILERHDLAEDSTRQANLEAAC